MVAFWRDIRLVSGHFILFDAIATWLAIVAVVALMSGAINRAIAPVLPAPNPVPEHR